MLKLDLDEKEVIRLYTEENKSCKQIGEIFNCDLTTIHRRLNNNNINTSYKGKPKSEKHKENLSETRKKLIREGKINSYFKKGHKQVGINPLKLKFTPKQEKEIIRLYEKELLESREIGKRFDCGEKPIFRILKKHNIKTKNSHRLKLLMEAGKISRTNSGSFGKLDKHPNWLGGKSFEPYGIEFNKKLKKAIKERDGCCMLCKIGFEDLKLLKRKINIHHINYDKQCNLPQNLISLCNPCHQKANFDREIWTKHFQKLLSKVYKYEYTETGEIILNLRVGG